MLQQKRRSRSAVGRCTVIIAPMCVVLFVAEYGVAWIGGSVPGLGKRHASQARRAYSVPAEVSTEVRGQHQTRNFRRYFVNKDGHQVSPWHDLPLRADMAGEYWMVTEIPRMTRSKMELATDEPWNPIAQDVKSGALREYHGPIFWNYGFLPQTWEDPFSEHPVLHVRGDNDPLDVVEVGSRTHEQGEVVRVRVLGGLAMIDGGELDWKIIVLSCDDPLAAHVQDIDDLQAKAPGVVSGIREWFRWYKAPDGKSLNSFGFGEAPLARDAAIEIIEETNAAWQRLRSGQIETSLWTGSPGARDMIA